MDARVAHEAPVHVVFYPTQGHVGGRRHVRHVQPHGDVGQGGALHLVKRAGVAEAQGEVGDALLGGPRVYCEPDALVGLHDDVASVHAKHRRAHPIDEAHRLVQVLREDDARPAVDGHLDRVLRHHLAILVVVDIAFRVAGNDRKGGRVGEEGGDGHVVELSTGAATDGEEERLRGLCQDVGHVVLGRFWIHAVPSPVLRRSLVACQDLP